MSMLKKTVSLGLLTLSLVACGDQSSPVADQDEQLKSLAGISLTTGQWVSLQVTTPGYTDRYLRHSLSLGFTEVVNASSNSTLKADATFRIVAALDGTPCYSLESRNFPGKFLRHQGFRLRIDSIGDDLMRKDATFCAQTGLADGSGVSLVSRNLPNYYIRHRNAEVWLDKDDNGAFFKRDATWNLASPWADTPSAPTTPPPVTPPPVTPPPVTPPPVTPPPVTPPPTGGSGEIGSIPASSIPGPSGAGVMALKVLNGTKGVYPDSEIYWGVLGINPADGRWSYLDLGGNLQAMSTAFNDAPGHLSKNGANYGNIYHRVSDASWASIPRITAGRLYVCVGSPCYIKTFDNGFAGPNVDNSSDPNLNVYFDFVEFTVDATGYHGNTTRVDGFGFPFEHRLVGKAGYDRTVGEPESETRAGIFNAFKAETPGEFTHLANIQAPYRIVAPVHGDFRTGGPQGGYFDGYVNSVFGSGTKPNTQQVLLCNGPLATDSGGCSALNRHVYQDRNNWSNVAAYYQAGPANYYARFWHNHALGRLAYGFAYDDYNQQAAYLEAGDPKGLILRVGW